MATQSKCMESVIDESLIFGFSFVETVEQIVPAVTYMSPA